VTETREQMEARHAAERAALEARGREMDRELLADAVRAFRYASGCKVITFDEVYDGLIAAAPLMPVQAMGEDAAKALDQAGQWFGEYAISHAAKGATEKAHRNAERAQFCFDAALRAHMTAEGADQ
jgi:hypothetical protein